jgi:sugar phosphate isomerase/epimerase
MRLAVFNTALQDLDRPAMLAWLAERGVEWLELGCGAYPGTRHADAHALRSDPAARAALQSDLRAHGVRLAALSCHGNPLHPDAALASRHQADLRAAVEAASALEVPVVVAFSGQPGSEGSTHSPNWPVVAWPEEFAALRERQWLQHIIPFWQAASSHAQSMGVTIALELHGGFAVHSPSTLLRLREACGAALAANIDPSHLWWQGIDPVAALRRLGSAVAHMHVKDTVFNHEALALHGLLDATPHSQPFERAWRFGVPGEGHDAQAWQGILNALTDIGYVGALSIEHEAPMPARDGIVQALHFMRGLKQDA